ncbi:MAG: glycosyltransferase family 2 protein [Chlamydiota bacterium]
MLKKIFRHPLKSFIALLLATGLFAFLYLAVRTSLFIITEYLWYEKIAALLLLLAEAFIIIHGLGYFLEIANIIRKQDTLLPQTNQKPPSNASQPPVAVVVASYHEPLDIIKKTLKCCYNLTYSNKQLYLLDDTRYDMNSGNAEELQQYKKDVEQLCREIGVNLFRRHWRGAKAGIINDFLDFINGSPKPGSSCLYSINSTPPTPKYLTVFDADHTPFPFFLEPLISLIEPEDSFAFVQTPQYYTNFQHNKIALASGLQQAVFYEYICAGKSIKDAMFCCGTNVLFRIKALEDVRGFDEASVTEDFATSFKLHCKGWRSIYYPKPSAFGLGPEDLGSYFQQQNRWATGTITLLKQVFKTLIKTPRKLNFMQWWEYFLSSTHYLIGFIFLIFILAPITYIFFSIPLYLAENDIFLIFFAPYLVFTLLSFYVTLARRNYSPRDLLLGQFLLTVTFPIYIKASIAAFTGKKSSFVVTNKGSSSSLSAKKIWPQLLLILLNIGAITWGFHKIYYGQGTSGAIILNSLWCFYNTGILSTIQYFNKPYTEKAL